jgi:2-succinyl-5-enolpyruvyl-6-hydroxy-3-cyclohexene-1-carboxylate synthase
MGGNSGKNAHNGTHIRNGGFAMTLTPSQVSYLNAFHCIDQLYASGVRSVWLSPGFRNSPIIAAAHLFAKERSDFSVSTSIDERGSGFAALGEALANKRPVAVVCTSGTAVANLYPAVLEAFHAGVPLIVVSCDRPQELHGVGANQTMDQWDFFSGARNFFAAISANNGEKTALANLRYLVAKAVAKSREPLGPAHLNISFREPFAFDAEAIQALKRENFDVPSPVFSSAVSAAATDVKRAVLEKISKAKNILLLGSLGHSSTEQRKRLDELSVRNGWCTLFEGSPETSFSSADFFLKDAQKRKLLQPDLILRFGAPLISKEIASLIKNTALGQIIFDASNEARNPEYGDAVFCGGEQDSWIAALAEMPVQKGSFREIAAQETQNAKEKLKSTLENAGGFTEWHSARVVGNNLEGRDLFLGNSMPVRDFLWSGAVFAKGDYRLFSNRGLSGIDGLIATSIGIAKGGRETVAVIGDLSAAHDASSFALLAALKDKLRLKILIMNNGGGEIFRMVGASAYPTDQTNFTTPVSIRFSDLASAYGVSFCRAQTAGELDSALKSSFLGVEVIEVCVDRELSTNLRKDFFSQWKT